MANKEKTSPAVASKASTILRSSTATRAEKTAAGSALSQAVPGRVTSPKVASTAAKIVDNPRASSVARSVGASVLTQKPNKR